MFLFFCVVLVPQKPLPSLTSERHQNIHAKLDQKSSLFATPERAAAAVTWTAGLVYAITAAPGGDPQDAARDMQLIVDLFDADTFLDGNTIFFTIFNSLGLLPLIYSATLLPGARDQSPIPPATLITSFALGFGGIGPYLALRQPRPEPVLRMELGPVARYFTENKLICAFPVLIASVALLVNMGNSIAGPDFGETYEEFSQMFATSRLTHISTLDFCVLSLFFFEPCREDMTRRGWWPSDPGARTSPTQIARIIGFCALPLLGPALYLVTRPQLLKGDDSF